MNVIYWLGGTALWAVYYTFITDALMAYQGLSYTEHLNMFVVF